MVVNYALGKIYKIVGGGLTYIGSTSQPMLCSRLSGHKTHYKRMKAGTGVCESSRLVFDADPDASIVLVENYPCSNKDELHQRERFYIETMECVNKYYPIRSREQLLKQKKDYYSDNREAVLAIKKEYRDNHHDEYISKRRAYKQTNREHIFEKNREYRAAHPPGPSIQCPCGSHYGPNKRNRHFQTKIHQAYEAGLVSNIEPANPTIDTEPNIIIV